MTRPTSVVDGFQLCRIGESSEVVYPPPTRRERLEAYEYGGPRVAARRRKRRQESFYAFCTQSFTTTQPRPLGHGHAAVSRPHCDAASASVVSTVCWYDECPQADIRWRKTFTLRANSHSTCTILFWE